MHHSSGDLMDGYYRADRQRFGDDAMFAPVHYHRSFDGGGIHDGFRNEFGAYRSDMWREPHFSSFRPHTSWYSPPMTAQAPIMSKPIVATMPKPISAPTTPPVFAEDRPPSSDAGRVEPVRATASPDTGMIGGAPSAITGAGKTVAETLTKNSTTIGNTLGRISTIDGVSLASAIQAIKSDTSINMAALPMTIRDAAFDRLVLLATEDLVFEIAAAAVVDNATLAGGQTTDDFLCADETTAATGVTPCEVVQQERAALDEVLRGLHDVGDAGTMEVHANQNNQKDGEELAVPLDDAKIVALEAALDGGMVLLPATGDANESDYDLLVVSSADEEFIGTHLRLSASVGLHQALDVAADAPQPSSQRESPPVGESAPAAEPQPNAMDEIKQPLVRSAAATVGFTTLLGVVAGKRQNERRRRSAEAYQARIRPIKRALRPGE
jgi:hypothetical protein